MYTGGRGEVVKGPDENAAHFWLRRNKALAKPLVSQIGHNNSVSGRLRPVLCNHIVIAGQENATQEFPSTLRTRTRKSRRCVKDQQKYRPYSHITLLATYRAFEHLCH
jgi:hypothetical protein